MIILGGYSKNFSSNDGKKKKKKRKEPKNEIISL